AKEICDHRSGLARWRRRRGAGGALPADYSTTGCPTRQVCGKNPRHLVPGSPKGQRGNGLPSLAFRAPSFGTKRGVGIMGRSRKDECCPVARRGGTWGRWPIALPDPGESHVAALGQPRDFVGMVVQVELRPAQGLQGRLVLDPKLPIEQGHEGG